MLTLKILEYLYYICVFLLLYKYTNGALIDSIKKQQLIEESSIKTTIHHTENYAKPNDNNKNNNTKNNINNYKDNNNYNDNERLKRTIENCNHLFSWLCLKVEFVQFLERLTERDEIPLFSGISLVRDTSVKQLKNSDILSEVARSYPNNGNDRLNAYLINKFNNYLMTHYLRLKLIDEQTILQARSTLDRNVGRKAGNNHGGGGAGGLGERKKGNYEALMAAGLMLKGTLMALGMGAVALIAGKAMMVALMALTIAAALGLRGLVGGRLTTYEIVTKPIYTTSHTHSMSYDDGHGHLEHIGGSGYGGYSRSLNVNINKSLY